MWHIFLPVVTGAVIGYVTNWLAIKMLFFPRQAWHIGGHRVPFTPGLFVARRQQFTSSLARLAEERFVRADQLRDILDEAEKSGVIDEFLDEMGSIFRFAYNSYKNKTPDDVFLEDCDAIARGLREHHVVSDTLTRAMGTMSTDEIEDMILEVVHSELSAITWVGAWLGGAIGFIQVWL